MSLFLTVDCWIRAADWLTASMELPGRINSSFCSLEFSHLTPSCILTRRVYFSPKKLRTSTKVPPSEIAQLMGKWAYTALILYLYPLVTPLQRLVMCEHTVLTAANSFFLPNHFSTNGFLVGHGNINSQVLE